jgi:hypothetical protein
MLSFAIVNFLFSCKSSAVLRQKALRKFCLGTPQVKAMNIDYTYM